MMVSFRALLTLVTVLFAASASHAQTAFKYRFKSGETLRYDLTIATTGTTRIDGKDMTGVEKQNILMAWHVESVDDKGAARIKLTVDRVKLSGEDPKASVQAASDTKDEPEKEPNKSMWIRARAMAKAGGLFTMTAQGEVKDVKIPASVLNDIRAVPGADKQRMAENWTEAGLHGTLKDSTFLFSTEPLAKGQTWKTKVDGGSPFGKLSGEVTYVYAGKVEHAGRTVEKFDVKPKLKIEPDPKAEVPVTIKTYETGGTVYFDNDTGRLVETQAVQLIEVQAEVKGKTFSQKTEVTTTMKLVK